MSHSIRFASLLLMVSVAIAGILFPGSADAQTTMTATANGPGGSRDDWNNPANWTSGIPSGAIDAIVSDGLTAEVWSNPANATPAYSGNLTLGVGTSLQIGWTTNFSSDANALGGGTITMNDGSEIRLRMPLASINPINMAGNATIHLSPSTSAHHQTRDFDGVITGMGTLTVIGNNNNTANFDTANPDWSGGLIANADDGWRVHAEASGTFGTGDVTINERAAGDRGVTLITNAPDVMDDFATLFVNGSKDNREVSKLILNADDTIGAFFLDGVDQGIGMFDASSGLLDEDGNPLITGSGILTVTGITEPPAEVIPEPASVAIWSLIGLGLAGFGVYRGRRKK